MTVLRVTAHMQSAVAMSTPLHLDALLFAAHPDARGCHVTRSQDLGDLADPPIPIPRIEWGGAAVYACSGVMTPTGARRETERLTKRRDPADVHALAAPVSIASGPGRDYCLPVPVLEARTLSWLCVGRRRSVMELLRYVRYVGTKRRHGHGAVVRWDVEPEDLPPRSVLVRDGVAVRYIPAGWCAWSDGMDRGPCRPPYWHSGRSEPRVVPGTRCELRDEVAALVGRLR